MEAVVDRALPGRLLVPQRQAVLHPLPRLLHREVDDGGGAAPRRGARARRDGLGVLAARLAQVGVQVDQAGQRDQGARVDDDRVVRCVEPGADLRDHAVGEEEVGALGAQR